MSVLSRLARFKCAEVSRCDRKRSTAAVGGHQHHSGRAPKRLSFSGSCSGQADICLISWRPAGGLLAAGYKKECLLACTFECMSSNAFKERVLAGANETDSHISALWPPKSRRQLDGINHVLSQTQTQTGQALKASPRQSMRMLILAWPIAAASFASRLFAIIIIIIIIIIYKRTDTRLDEQDRGANPASLSAGPVLREY